MYVQIEGAANVNYIFDGVEHNVFAFIGQQDKKCNLFGCGYEYQDI